MADPVPITVSLKKVLEKKMREIAEKPLYPIKDGQSLRTAKGRGI